MYATFQLAGWKTDGLDPYIHLADLVTNSPGRAASSTALGILRQLSCEGDEGAQSTIAKVLAAELEQPTDSPLAEIYRLGCQPARFLTDDQEVAEIVHRLGDDLQPFQALVKRHATVEDDALKAYVLAVFGTFLASGVWPVPFHLRLDVLDKILASTRVVEGTAATDDFRFGRDLLLAMGSFGSLIGVIGHELGHPLIVPGVGTEPLAPRVEASAQLLERVDQALPNLIQAALNRAGEPVSRAEDERVWRSQGLSIICTFQVPPGGGYLHVSFADSGGPLDLSTALVIAHHIVGMLKGGANEAAVAVSARGVVHLGMRGQPPLASLKAGAPIYDDAAVAAALAWYDRLAATGRVGRSEADIPRLLSNGALAFVFTDHPRAWEEEDLCDAVEGGAVEIPQENDAGAALLALAVRCGRPDTVAQVLAQCDPIVPPGVTAPGLERLGTNICVVLHGSHLTYRGPTNEDLWRTLRHLVDAGFGIEGAVTADGQTLLTDAAARPGQVVDAAAQSASSPLLSGSAAALPSGDAPGLMERLLTLGVDVDAPNPDGETALIIASRTGDSDKVGKLLAGGATVTARDRAGATALLRAAGSTSSGTNKVLRLLLQPEPLGSFVAPRETSGAAPLIQTRSAAVCEQLIASGADVEARDHAQRTPLMLAAARGNIEVVRRLLDAGAALTAMDDQGLTALHFGALVPARYGSCGVIEALLSHGADVDVETDDSVTPLMFAVIADEPDTVQCLLDAGASVAVPNADGQTALDLAKGKLVVSGDMIASLRAAGAADCEERRDDP